jgi:tetratricopeptide (TPR) repeat protein
MFTGLALLLIISKAEPTAQFSGGDISSWQYFMTQWRAYLRYMAMYFFSYDLNADNLQFGFSTSLRDKGVLLALIFNLAVLGLGALFWRKVPVATFAIVWFYVAITPASSVVVLSEPVNDHRAYLSYFGLFMLGAMALEQIRVRNRRVFVLVAAVLVLVYSTQTFTRAKDWGNSERLWRDTVMKNPISVRAKNNLAVELMSMARYEEALNWLDECVATGRLYANCFTNRAIVKAALGRDAEAESDFALGAQYDPSGVQARASWARFLSTRGFLQRALEQLQASDQHAGGRNFEVRMELMRTLLRMGDRNTVRSLLEESFRIFGSNERLLSFQTRYELN